MSKLTEFIKRNQIRNAKLYHSGLISGRDYVVCPASNQRLIIIRSDYITKVLEMTVEEYDRKFPNVQKRCKAHGDNIRHGIHTVDPQTGLTKYQLSQVKSQATLSKVDATGMSGYDRKVQKTRATHMNNIDELGRNGYRRQADARLTTVLSNGLTVEENAHRKQKETLIIRNKSGTGGASNISKKVLTPVLDYLNETHIKYYFDRSEFCFKDTESGNYYFMDLTIPSLNLAIEYQSNAWHADPRMDENKWNCWKQPRGKTKPASEVLNYDYNKAKSLFRTHGYVTYYVWENSKEEDIEGILCLLKTPNMKY